MREKAPREGKRRKKGISSGERTARPFNVPKRGGESRVGEGGEKNKRAGGQIFALV